MITVDSPERKMYGSPKIDGLDVWKNAPGQIIMDDQLHAQALDQRQDHPPMDGGDHMHPISRKARQVERCTNQHTPRPRSFA